MSYLLSIKARLGFHFVNSVPKRQHLQILPLVPVPPVASHLDLVVSPSVSPIERCTESSAHSHETALFPKLPLCLFMILETF